MDKAIIRNHNQRVKPEDIVYFLGDFCFRNTTGGKKGEGTTHKANYYLEQLNGRFVFIRGNHDGNNSLKTILIGGVIEIGGKKFWMCHNPRDLNSKYRINLCGHVHEKYRIKKVGATLLYNVGVDVHKYIPITFNEIMKNINKWLKNNGRKEIHR